MNDILSGFNEFVLRLSDRNARYRVCLMQVGDAQLLARLGKAIENDFAGVVLDPLSAEFFDDQVGDLRPMRVIDWLAQSLTGSTIHYLYHLDPIIGMWQSPTDQRVWWEQLAIVENSAPLLVGVLPVDISAISAWGHLGSLWVKECQAELWAPRASGLYQQLIGDGV